MSLWLCLRLEQLPLECLSRGEEQPVVVLERQRVVCTNDSAAALGVRPDMGSATVRALVGDGPLKVLERDTAAEQRSLQQLCCWAYGITPTLHSWRDDCLQLEIGGCLGLFRGLDRLLLAVRNGLASRGYHAHCGLAATPAAAWLLSHGEAGLTHEQDLAERLAPLPLSLLRADFGTTVDSLRRAGLHRLGDILNLPQAALGRRCGKGFVHFLQQVLGQRDDLRPDYQPPASFSDEYWFGYEVKVNDELLPAVELLLQGLCRFLRNTQLQCSEIRWQLVGLDGQIREVIVRSSSCHSRWQDWYQLTRIRFEQLELEGAVEGLALDCTQLQAGQLDSVDLFAPRHQREPLGQLLDRLRNRLGLKAVERVGCRDEHLPELALCLNSEAAPEAAADVAPCALRPFWLMPTPQPLKQHGSRLYWQGALELVHGPERIEDNWWQEPVSRDYYVARSASGDDYWVFRDRLSRGWFIHGIFA
ncbi:MAG: DNA polymerase Y family protein [Pseudomonadota bacterium]